MTEESGRQDGQGASCVRGDDDKGIVGQIGRVLGDEDAAHAVVCAEGIVVAVGQRAGQTDEHRAGEDLSRIAGEGDHIGRGGIDSRTVDDLIVINGAKQFTEQHDRFLS